MQFRFRDIGPTYREVPSSQSLSLEHLFQCNPEIVSYKAAEKMEDKLGVFLQCVGLIALTIICGRGSLAAEEGHGPEDINFVIEEGESNTATFAPEVLSHELPFEDITILGKRTTRHVTSVSLRGKTDYNVTADQEIYSKFDPL